MKEVKKEEKSNKKKIVIFSLIFIVLVGAFIFWWFNRKFDVTFKFNDGSEDSILKVKYLRKIDLTEIEEKLQENNKTFIGWFETYYLDGEQIESIKKDSELEKTICKEGFKINSTKLKCVSETEFDFDETKIKSNTIIEAFWSTILFSINPTSKTINVGDSFTISSSVSGAKDKTVKFTSSDTSIATVTSAGKVVGVKKGTTTIIAESNGIKKRCNVTVNEVVKETPKEEPKEEPVVVKDEGTISLKSNKQCIIGTNEVTVTATVSSNAIDKTVNWNNKLKCYNLNSSDNVLKISRIGRGTMCRSTEETSPVISASLNNGNNDSLTLSYEPGLAITVYNGSNVIEPSERDGYYYGNSIKVVSNVDADFSVTNEFLPNVNYTASKTNTSVTLVSTCDAKITIKTACGQTKTIEVKALIN